MLPMRLRYVAETGFLLVRVLCGRDPWTVAVQCRSEDDVWEDVEALDVHVGDAFFDIGPLARERRCMVSVNGLPAVTVPL
jgi:hypothetical protein